MKPAKITIVFAEDHKMFREGIVRFIHQNPAYKVVAQAGNGIEALLAVEKHQPDILLLDINMPLMNGHEVMQELHKKGSKVRVIILSMYDSDEIGFYLLKKKAVGVLSKSAEPAEIYEALETVKKGMFYAPAHVLSQGLHAEDEKTFAAVTDTDLSLVRCYIEGLTIEETMRKMGKCKTDVEKMRKILIEKLSAKSMAEVVAILVHKGFIFPEGNKELAA